AKARAQLEDARCRHRQERAQDLDMSADRETIAQHGRHGRWAGVAGGGREHAPARGLADACGLLVGEAAGSEEVHASPLFAVPAEGVLEAFEESAKTLPHRPGPREHHAADVAQRVVVARRAGVRGLLAREEPVVLGDERELVPAATGAGGERFGLRADAGRGGRRYGNGQLARKARERAAARGRAPGAATGPTGQQSGVVLR